MTDVDRSWPSGNPSLSPRSSSPRTGDGALDDAVVGRTVERSLVRHERVYTDEVRRLLDAGLEVMRREGTTKSPRVVDIIEHAGLSRDAFYRHFTSKEELVGAIVEAGARRLVGYAEHMMQKADTPDDKIRSWIDAVMAQAIDPEVARTTRAVLWNGAQVPDRATPAAADPTDLLADLLVAPLADMASTEPERDAQAIANAVMGTMRSALASGTTPGAEVVDHLAGFCLAGVHRTGAPVRMAGTKARRA